MIKTLKINDKDMVAVLLEDGKENDKFKIEGREFVLNDKIPFGHKVAIENIPPEKNIIKYGEVIGYATQKINKGDWVHTHNIKSDRGRIKGGGK